MSNIDRIVTISLSFLFFLFYVFLLMYPVANCIFKNWVTPPKKDFSYDEKHPAFSTIAEEYVIS